MTFLSCAYVIQQLGLCKALKLDNPYTLIGIPVYINLRGCQTIDKVDQLLWAWFSFPRKSADEIVEP